MINGMVLDLTIAIVAVGIFLLFLIISGEQRINKIGSFLRSTLLDELLKFLNIFKNDMSMAGWMSK